MGRYASLEVGLGPARVVRRILPGLRLGKVRVRSSCEAIRPAPFRSPADGQAIPKGAASGRGPSSVSEAGEAKGGRSRPARAAGLGQVIRPAGQQDTVSEDTPKTVRPSLGGHKVV